MYCVNCGVKLGDSEKKCPLCGITAYHPELPPQQGQRLYPQDRYPVQQVRPRSALIILTTLFLLPILITLLCDLQINGCVTWSGYVIGALLLGYEMFILPMWFRKPNPVVFVPCGFAAVALYLLYINLATGGKWFLSFAFPMVGAICAIVTTVVVLTRYLSRKTWWFTFGGANIALGGSMVLMEFLINITFQRPFMAWSLYPLIVLVLVGGMLIFLGINRQAREKMERKLFI